MTWEALRKSINGLINKVGRKGGREGRREGERGSEGGGKLQRTRKGASGLLPSRVLYSHQTNVQATVLTPCCPSLLLPFPPSLPCSGQRLESGPHCARALPGESGQGPRPLCAGRYEGPTCLPCFHPHVRRVRPSPLPSLPPSLPP